VTLCDDWYELLTDAGGYWLFYISVEGQIHCEEKWLPDDCSAVGILVGDMYC